MAIFLLQLPADSGMSIVDGVTRRVVEADSAAVARRVASAQDHGDSPWAGATATEIASGIAADLEGFTYNVRVGPAVAGNPNSLDVTYVGVAGDTVDLIGDALAFLLIAEGLTASYNSGTNVLTVAAIADGIGDRALCVTAKLPGAADGLSDLVGNIVHGGIAGAVLSVVLTPPTAIPAIMV